MSITIAFHNDAFLPGVFEVHVGKLGSAFELGTHTVDGIVVFDDLYDIYATAETVEDAESAILKHYVSTLIGDAGSTVQEACAEVAKIERRYS